MRWKAILIGVVVIVTLLLVGCGSAKAGPLAPTARPQETEANTTVSVVAREFSLEPSVDSVPAGEVTFELDNQGAEEHEMIVIRTDVPADSLPMSASEAHRVDEDAPGVIGEISETAPGASGKAEFHLAPGRYLLFCNIAGHYESGMVTEFQVK